ncbi:MAG: tRNA lysidine(34) synthetase TilS [bacterium]
MLDNLAAIIKQHSDRYGAHYVLAYSGGMDSQVLLHYLAHLNTTKIRLRAIHIDHGLQPDSAQWAKHCEQQCHRLAIPCQTIALKLVIPKKHSLEAYAREARYAALCEQLKDNETLLTAHHQRDQAETLLLQLLRGAGVNGLAAMPMVNSLSTGQHFRPLLTTPYDALKAYAEKYQLNYIDDPSNQDRRFDRNFLRHEILPLLQQRWSAAMSNLSRASQWQAENRALLADYVQTDYQQCVVYRPNGTDFQQNARCLQLNQLLAFSPLRQKAIIRHWLADLAVIMPNAKKLAQIMQHVLTAKADAQPCVRWANVAVRRYQQALYLLQDHPSFRQKNERAEAAYRYQWDLQQDFVMPHNKQCLRAEFFAAWKSILQTQGKMLTIRCRQNGEKVRLPQRNQRISLKDLMQTLSIPPWERTDVPLLFLDDQLIACYGYKIYETG